MAVLPVFTAWTLNLTLAYDVALAGMYLFLRRQSISTTGAAFGAATFAFAGYMTAQIVHIDLIEGAAWLPWTLVAIHALTERPTPGPGRPSAGERAGHRRAVRTWVALLAVSVGLSLLTGSAEAIIDARCWWPSTGRPPDHLGPPHQGQRPWPGRPPSWPSWPG